jgi:hypothetical protein
MSEYQYYEFQAVDRPLDEQEMAELRRLSTRATITPTRFVNVYNFGNFRGDPATLMERYFDAHLYVANWGTHEFMLRLPHRLLDMARVAPYCTGDCLQARIKDDFLILEFRSETEDGEDFVEGEGQLAGLLPVRAELAAGDPRALYLGWLASAQDEFLEEDAIEPPPPPGLGQPSAALRALADLLRVDDALLAAAAERSLPLQSLQPDNDELTTWVRGLAESEKELLLLRFLREEGMMLRAEVLRQVEAAHAPAEDGTPERRTVQQLLQAAEQQRERQRQAAAAQAAQRQREQAAARATYLAGLAGREDTLWGTVGTIIEEKQISEYDRAVELLRDLRDLAARSGQAAAFQMRLQQLREQFRGRSGLLRRLDEARLR